MTFTEELQRAWAAGFIDGDGAVMIVRNNRQVFQVRLEAYQVDDLPLLKLLELFGGRICPKPGKTVMNVWRQVGQAALPTLQQIVPYLTVKKPRAELAIDFLEKYSATSFEQRNEMFEGMRELQKVGKSKWLM